MMFVWKHRHVWTDLGQNVLNRNAVDTGNGIKASEVIAWQ